MRSVKAKELQRSSGVHESGTLLGYRGIAKAVLEVYSQSTNLDKVVKYIGWRLRSGGIRQFYRPILKSSTD